MPAPDLLLHLVQRFTENLPAYRAAAYKEASVRHEFIDPFFEALGWDMYNRRGYAEAYKQVVVEDALRISGAVKAPDYAFRIGGMRKFFVEAKAASVRIKEEISPAFQLRRYAWSARLPLSILTDFEEFAVYDCRGRPDKSDKASTGRILFLTYQDYVEKWDEIAAIFSPQAILTGSFDKYAEAATGKHGTAEVDDAFLAEIERWRELLAHNFALRNPQLNQRDLNYAVQMTIDRIIFLRICEDRGIEPYEQLKKLLKTGYKSADSVTSAGGEIYPRLRQLFRKADERYNSGLFHFRPEKAQTGEPDELTLGLALDDKPLKDILGNLYFPDSPYEFSVLPVEILGQVYEQFLGKVIRLTSGHRAVVEEKPEVKKAGGVFYTPTYIVDYIVRHTLGALLEGKRPGDPGVGGKGEPLRVLDPACGSGSFLLGAYQYLLDWYRDNYLASDPEKWAKGALPHLVQISLPAFTGRGAVAGEGGQAGGWRLTTSERKRILLEHIYGVDIDPQAVEVTKLSLLLKVLEGESEQSIKQQFTLWQERALPDLALNIQCGNSLIGPDFNAEAQMSFLDAEEQYRINAFDWQRAFPKVFAGAGGFDAVIGNPPYIRSQSLGEAQRAYYRQKYTTATATYDIYVLFVEKAVSILAQKGRCGFILPNKFFTTDYGEGLRKLLTQQKLVESMVDFEDAQIFEGAGTYTTLLFLSETPVDKPQYARLGSAFRTSGRAGLAKTLSTADFIFAPIALSENGARWTLAAGESGQVLLRLQKSYPPLSVEKPHIFQGLKTSADKVYILKVEGVLQDECRVINGMGDEAIIERELLKQMVKGEHVQRYYTNTTGHLFILYPYRVDMDGNAVLLKEAELKSKYPKAWEYLNKYRKMLGARDNGKWSNRADWYAYARSQNISTFLGPKYLVPYMTTRLRTNFDREGKTFFVNITTGGYGLRIKAEKHAPTYVLGVLNSALMNSCIKQMTNQFRGGYFAVNKQALERLPFRPIDFSDPADAARHTRMVALVERLLALHPQLAAAKTPAEKTHLQRQIEATDGQIDGLVYELFGLTQEEIGIVEGKS